MKSINDKNINNALKNSNINIDELKAAAQSGNAEQYISRALPKDASDKIKKILANKEETQKILSTPQAKDLLNKLMNK